MPAGNSRDPRTGSQPEQPNGGRVFGRTAPPSGSQSGQPNGGRVFGRTAPQSGRTGEFRTPNGGMVSRSSNGGIREVRTPTGATVYHGPGGQRRVEVVRPGNRVVVATRNGGYVQRPAVYHGREYTQRTYIRHGVTVVRVYQPYRYGGIVLNVYRPVRYYPPAYYYWAYSPWDRPIRYSWGWYRDPWYGYYGGYFTPYPVYSSPSLWLTDYLVASTLQAAYEEQAAASMPVPSSGFEPMSANVKAAIADEVRRQLEQERMEQQQMQQTSASGPEPPLFGGGNIHTFVVSSSLAVASSMGECAITDGDVLQLNGTPPPSASSAEAIVLASKGADCRAGIAVSVPVADLQEMQNHMRETLDMGLADLRSKQGQGEMPPLPANASGPSADAPYAAELRPDADAAVQVRQSFNDADREAQEVVNQSLAGDPEPRAAAPRAGASTDFAVGQTIAEIVKIMGPPQSTFDGGAKQLYIYKNLKFTFVNGRLTTVE
jgi:hypothetical protein